MRISLRTALELLAVISFAFVVAGYEYDQSLWDSSALDSVYRRPVRLKVGDLVRWNFDDWRTRGTVTAVHPNHFVDVKWDVPGGAPGWKNPMNQWYLLRLKEGSK